MSDAKIRALYKQRSGLTTTRRERSLTASENKHLGWLEAEIDRLEAEEANPTVGAQTSKEEIQELLAQFQVLCDQLLELVKLVKCQQAPAKVAYQILDRLEALVAEYATTDFVRDGLKPVLMLCQKARQEIDEAQALLS